MSFVTSLQAYVNSNTPSELQVSIDWGRKVVFVPTTNFTDFFIQKFDFTDGTLFGSQDVTTIAPGAEPLPMGMDVNANLYMSKDGLSNFVGFMRLKPDLTFRDEWGTASSGWNVPDGLPPPIQWCQVMIGGTPYMAGTSSEGVENPDTMQTGWPVYLMTAFSPFNYVAGPVLMPDATLIPCASNINGHFYVAGVPTATDVLHIYRFDCDPATFVEVTIATINPAAVDAAWLHIDCPGMVQDQTDGNLIVKVHNGDAVTNHCYIIKVRVSDGAILWKVPVFTLDSHRQMTSAGRILHGKYCHFSEATGGPTPATVYTIDTLTGAYTSYTDNLSGFAGLDQCFDDTTGAILINCSYTEGVGSPVPLNSTPSTFSGWAALYVIEAYAPPIVPGAAFGYSEIWGNYP